MNIIVYAMYAQSVCRGCGRYRLRNNHCVYTQYNHIKFQRYKVVDSYYLLTLIELQFFFPRTIIIYSYTLNSRRPRRHYNNIHYTLYDNIIKGYIIVLQTYIFYRCHV